jgi:hypothetical protein
VHEDVAEGVGVSGHEVRGGALEGEEAAVGRDRGEGAVAAALDPGRVDADAHGRSADEVADEDVLEGIAVARDEVRGAAVEGHEAPVGGDPGVRALAVALRAAAVDADAHGRPQLAVAQEDVAHAVGVARDEVRGRAVEGHVAAVGRDRGEEALLVGLGAGAVDADALGRAVQPVAQEDVDEAVEVAGDEVGRGAAVGHVAPVVGDRRIAAVVVPEHAGRVHADHLGRAALAVAQEDVAHAVGVGRDEVGRGALEGHVAAVPGDRQAEERAVVVPRDRPGRIDADAVGRAQEAVAHEDVVVAVDVAGDEVRGRAAEGDEAAVGGDLREAEAGAVALRPSRGDADALGGLGPTQAAGEDQDRKTDCVLHGDRLRVQGFQPTSWVWVMLKVLAAGQPPSTFGSR